MCWEHCYQWWGIPAGVSVSNLVPCSQEKLSVTHCTPCSISLGFPYTFSPGLPDTWRSTGSISYQEDGGQGEITYFSLLHSGKFILTPLIVTAGKLCVILFVLSGDSLPLWDCQWEQIYHFVKEFWLLLLMHRFLETWTKPTKLAFVHREHPRPQLGDSQEGSAIYCFLRWQSMGQSRTGPSHL